MVLEIYDANLVKISEVDYESSPYDQNMLNRMAKNGYSFRLDGTWILRGTRIPSSSTSTSTIPDTIDIDNLDLSNQGDSYIDNFDAGPITTDETLDDTKPMYDESNSISYQDQPEQMDITNESNITTIEDTAKLDVKTTGLDPEITLTPANLSEESSKSNAEPKKSKSRPKIRCIETGVIYDSQAQAARELGIDPTYVSDSIKTGKRRLGYSFEKVIEDSEIQG